MHPERHRSHRSPRSRAAWLASLLVAPLALAATAASASAGVACGARIAAGEAVVLDRDLACDDVAAALIVTGPAVVDLNGFALGCTADGVRRVGVVLVGEGATLRNGTVADCHHGVLVAGRGRHVVDDVAVIGASDGFTLASDANRVTASHAFFNRDRGFVVTGDGNAVADSTAAGNAIGFRVAGRATLSRNVADRNEREGYLVTGSGAALHENRAIGSRIGFQVHGSGHHLVRNEGRGNLLGVFLDRATRDNLVLLNVMSGNLFTGIVATGDGNRLAMNHASDNAAHGVQVTSSARSTTVVGTTARSNGVHDLADDTPGCGAVWRENEFETSNQPCIR